MAAAKPTQRTALAGNVQTPASQRPIPKGKRSGGGGAIRFLFHLLRKVFVTAAIFFYVHTVLSSAGKHCLSNTTAGGQFCQVVRANAGWWKTWTDATPLPFRSGAGIDIIENNLGLGLTIPTLAAFVLFLWLTGASRITQDVGIAASLLLLISHLWYSPVVDSKDVDFLAISIAISLLLFRGNSFSDIIFSIVTVGLLASSSYSVGVALHPEHMTEVERHLGHTRVHINNGIAIVRGHIREIGHYVLRLVGAENKK